MANTIFGIDAIVVAVATADNVRNECETIPPPLAINAFVLDPIIP